MMKLWLFTLIFTVTAVAQSPNVSVHTHNNPDLIDGSKTPELIPDRTAWRLWLLSVTAKDPQHSELDQARQDAYLLSAGFEDEDLPVMRQALYDFKAAYDSMLADHNQSVKAGLSPSTVSLKTRLDSLVKQTQTTMLSVKVETEAKVRAFLRSEKRRMRVSKTEVQ